MDMNNIFTDLPSISACARYLLMNTIEKNLFRLSGQKKEWIEKKKVVQAVYDVSFHALVLLRKGKNDEKTIV
jgi:hypothetical protein